MENDIEGNIIRGEVEIDIDDEIQDWKSLDKLSKSSKNAPVIPKRGEKDFEPDGTNIQDKLLQESREAMYSAIDGQRSHHIRQKLEAVWISKEQKALVIHARGSFFKDMGNPVNFGKKIHGVYLNPYETVYLVERGSMIIYLGNEEFEHFLNNDEIEFDYNNLKALNLGHLYSLAFSSQQDMVDKYQVYSYLKRHGYLIREFKHINDKDQYTRYNELCKAQKPGIGKFFSGIVSFLLGPKIINKILDSAINGFRKIGLLSYPFDHSLHFITKHYFNYRSIFKSLGLVQSYSSYGSLKERPVSDSKYSLDFNVWKPTPKFSKKAPPTPDFQICIVNIDKSSFPDLNSILNLFNEINYEFPQERTLPREQLPVKKKKNAPPTKRELRLQRQKERQDKLDDATKLRNSYLKLRSTKLKFGSSSRSVILATINSGVINFMNLSEGDFSLKNDICNKDLEEIYPNKDHGIIFE